MIQIALSPAQCDATKRALSLVEGDALFLGGRHAPIVGDGPRWLSYEAHHDADLTLCLEAVALNKTETPQYRNAAFEVIELVNKASGISRKRTG